MKVAGHKLLSFRRATDLLGGYSGVGHLERKLFLGENLDRYLRREVLADERLEMAEGRRGSSCGRCGATRRDPRARAPKATTGETLNHKVGVLLIILIHP